MESDFEIFSLSQQVFVMTEEMWLSSLPAFPCLNPGEKNLDNPLIFLLSGVYIKGMAQRHQGVGIWHIVENNKIVSLFTVFLKRSCFQSKRLIRIYTVVCSKMLSKVVLSDPYLLAFLPWWDTHP